MNPILTRPVVVAVDDEPEILALVRNALEREGIEVHTAQNVAECLEISAATRADLFVIDLTLPDGSGFDLVRNLRVRHDGGIIILSGRDEETDNVLGLELGADDYVVKPFRPREFAARVNAVLRRYRQSPKQTPPGAAETDPSEADIDHRFGEYSVSRSSRMVFDGEGREIPLTTAEFDLLCALLASRGRVVDRDHLMNAIKGREWEAYDRAIDGLVSRLRKKLPAPRGRAHFIRTVHGVGYSFTG